MSEQAMLFEAGRQPKKNGTPVRGLLTAERRGWLVCESAPLGPGVSDFARPGLWKTYRGGGMPRRVFAIPPRTRALLASATEENALVQWAHATQDGDVPDGWCAPEREHLRALPVVNLGGTAVPLETFREPNRLTVRATLATNVSAASDERRDWLERVLADAHERWQLVRIGVDHDTVRAEIDLSGAPAPDALFALSAAALFGAVRWVLPSVTLILDPGVDCETLSSDSQKRS